MLKGIVTFFIAALLIALLYLNYGLYYQPGIVNTADGKHNDDILQQLTFLQDRMHKGAAEDMQGVYPEGFVFMHALYGLTWAEFAGQLNSSTQAGLFKRAEGEIGWSLSHINSSWGTEIFPVRAAIPFGAFYTGWNSYLLGKKLSIEPMDKRDSAEVHFFEYQCRHIAAYIDSGDNPYAESYAGYAWPADMSACVAALALHDRIMKPEFDGTIHKWIDEVKLRLDKHGLMPHAVNYKDGTPLQDARGSSQSLILNFLYDIDRPFANRQFEIYRKLFLTHRLGLPGIREYPGGTDGSGDSDSGPVIWGVGGSASIVGLRTMTLFGDTATAVGLRNSIEAFGVPQKTDGQKKYIFGVLPMADAFIAWANSADMTVQLKPTGFWQWGFQLFSLISVVLILVGLRWMWKK